MGGNDKKKLQIVKKKILKDNRLYYLNFKLDFVLGCDVSNTRI